MRHFEGESDWNLVTPLEVLNGIISIDPTLAGCDTGFKLILPKLRGNC